MATLAFLFFIANNVNSQSRRFILQFSSSSESLLPKTPALEAALDDVWEIINRQQAKPARQACDQLIARCSGSADVWFASSFLAFQMQQFELALQHIEPAIEIEPENERWQLHKAHTLLRMQRRKEADALVTKLLDINGESLDFYSELALVLNALQRYDEAQSQYQKALNLLNAESPKHSGLRAQLLFNLASVQRYLGDIDAAEASLDDALQLTPLDTEAQLLRSGLRKQTHENNHIAELESVQAKTSGHFLQTAQVCYALAKELEDIGEFDDSFTALQQGANARRSIMQYDVARDEAILTQLATQFDADWFDYTADTVAGYENDEALFILGLPRTGSTLVERLLSQDPQVHVAGELNQFSLQMMQQIRAQGQNARTPQELICHSGKLDFTELGASYINSTRPETGHTRHFIDKLPLNSLNMPLISRALPDAKIIYVQRSPMDTCYAIYKNLFTHGYPFSYQLDELARYYAAHYRLMQQWLKSLGEAVHVIHYEKLVAEPELEGRKLFAFCNLLWRDEYTQTQRNQAPSNTASAAQVRQPIYQGSVEKWRCYEAHLRPLRQQLQALGVPC